MAWARRGPRAPPRPSARQRCRDARSRRDLGPKATPAIILRGHHYTVLDIFYDSKSIILADSDVLHGGSCPVVLHDLSFDKLWLQNTSSNENLTFYFGCYTSRSSWCGGAT